MIEFILKHVGWNSPLTKVKSFLWQN
jgi:hypothetical protein